MKKQQFKRLLSLVIAVVMCLGLAIPAGATDVADGSSVIVEKVDNSRVSASLRNPGEAVNPAEQAPIYADTDNVRVSIVLEAMPAIRLANLKGISTTEIASSSTVMNYRQQLKLDQMDMADRISVQALGGRELDVVWNLTLAANIISANVQYGKIDAIAAIPGVKEVIVETRYEPAVVSKGEADPNMATSSEQIGSTSAYLEGYDGAGSRIAIIDTGTDTDHQSFDNGAFLYALQQGAAAAGMEYDAYVASLNLLDVEEIASLLPQLHVYERMRGNVSAEDLYVNEKLGFGFNYIDASLNLDHDNDKAGEHGSHVAGIATANRYIPDGEGGYVEALDAVCVQGVAPDAQLITMKVFGAGGGAYPSDYMVAIEDAIMLGCDSVNLSLGSVNPGMTENSTFADILAELSGSDTVVTMSGGNDGGWADESTNGLSYLFYDDVSMHTSGSPGTYTNSLSVASVNNSGYTLLGFEVAGNKIGYTESFVGSNGTAYTNQPFATLAGEQEYVIIDGIGTPEDWAAVGDALVGKIAMCSRGETSFYEKANAAVEAGAIGVVIYNNQAGIINMDLTDYSYTAPVVSITQADGAIIKAASTDMGGYYTGTMTISEKTVSGQYGDEYYTMSSFSSWGVPGDLSMKPEITAPGGAIYSVFGSIPSLGGLPANTATDKYEMMSGTSMAAPQVAGMMALLMQHIRENGLSVDGLTDRALAQSLLMSTAVPLFEKESGGQYYSVLKQGAGLANIGAAVQANSYILMGADANDSYFDGKVKVELGDDPAKTGEYSFTFSINNMTGEEQSYTLDADFFTQDIFDATGTGVYMMNTWTAPLGANVSYSVNGVPVVSDTDLLGMDFDGDNDVDLDDGQALLDYATGKITALSNAAKADLDEDQDVDSYDAYLFFSRMGEGVVTVPANGSVTVTVDVMLDQNDLYLNFYPNGAYVEGYVYVCGMSTEEGVMGEAHSIPVLGFYGNWTDASMFDKGSYWAYVTGAETLPGYLFGENNVFTNFMTVKYAGDPEEYIFGGNSYIADDVYMPERDAISTETGDVLDKLYFTAIRNAGASKFEIIDAATGEVYSVNELGMVSGAYYYANGEAWDQTQRSLNLGWNGTDAEGDKLNNNTVVDLVLTLAPELYANADGSYNWDALGKGASLTTRVTIDNTAPELVGDEPVVIDQDAKTLTITVRDNQYVAAVALFDAYGQYIYAAAGADPDAEARKAITYVLDISEVNGSSFLLQVYDYAGNTTTYEITEQIGEVTDEVTGITLSQNSAVLALNNTLQLSAFVEPVNATNRDVIWMSTDESVAIVDENGLVTAVGEGSALIAAFAAANDELYDVCEITAISIDYTLTGVLQDEAGAPMSFRWNLAEAATWSKVADLPMYPGSAAGVGPQYAFIMDTTSAISVVDITTGQDMVTYNPVGAPFDDMSYSYLSDLVGADLLNVTYGSWVFLMQDPSAPDMSGLNMAQYLASYSGGSYLIGIETEGIAQDGNGYYELIYALDNAGMMWAVKFYFQTGRILLGYIPTDLDFSHDYSNDFMYTSLVLADDGETFFFSGFNGETNVIYMLTLGDDGLNAVEIGNVGADVWPAFITYAAANEPASSTDALGSENLELCTQTVSEELNIEKFTTETPATGTLNSVAVVEDKVEIQRSTSEVAPEEETVELVVTAKDALGEDVDSTNGVFTVTYDAESLAVDSIVVHGDYESIVVDETAGTITIGYVSLAGIEAGDAIATINFVVNKTTDGQFAINHKETGNEKPGYVESVEVSYDHTYGDWYEYTPATCTEAGEERRDCQFCDAYESRVLNPLNHSYGDWYEYTPATCTEAGEEHRDCVRCDAYESRAINPLNHSYGEWYEYAPATCTEAGEEHRDCVRCDAYESRAINPLNHSYGEWYEYAPATCTEAGEEHRDCVRCDAYESRAINPLNHSYGEWYEYTPATCTESGEEHRDCVRCDAYETRAINPLNHNWGDWYVHQAPTCTGLGEERRICANDAEHYQSRDIAATGHAMGEWYEYTPATCTEPGEERKDCANCDHYESRPIEATGHTMGDWYEYAPATCTAPGEERMDCANCDHYESRPIDILDHVMGDWYVVAPATEQVPGEIRCDCANCDYYETDTIPVLSGSVSEIPAPGPVNPPMDPNVPAVPELPFKDVKVGDRFYDSVKYVYDKGLMVGVSDDSFDTETTLTRAMLVTTLYRLENKPAVDFAGTFSDVADGKWYSEAVEWAAANGIILGYTDGNFGVNDAVTNEQLAAILYRYAAMKGYDLSAVVDLDQYTDGGKISDYAIAAMIWSLGNDLTATENNLIAARQGATRGQVAYALHHLMVNVMGY